VVAVDCPELRNTYTDVLVLPTAGDVSLAAMCSGGDFDGDDFVVIWDQAYVAKFTPVCTPPSHV
jgi:RNA-dependent RNA polymerase